MKEKKIRKFGVRLENEVAQTIGKIAGQLKISQGELIRLCVDQQLEDTKYLKTLTWKKKAVQFHMVFEESQFQKLNELSNQTGLSQAEVVRFCLLRQLKQIQRQGGIKLKLNRGG